MILINILIKNIRIKTNDSIFSNYKKIRKKYKKIFQLLFVLKNLIITINKEIKLNLIILNLLILLLHI